MLFKKLKIPTVAGFVITGVFLGESVFNIFHHEILEQLRVVNSIALGLIALVIGGELRLSNIRQLGKSVFVITLGEAFGAFILVTAALQLMYHNWALSLLLGSISAATAPAATVLVINELKAKGIFTKTLLAIVAIDDALALLIFGVCSTFSASLISGTEMFSIQTVISTSMFQIFGSIALGLGGGMFVAPIVRRFRTSENNFILVIGVLFLLIGITEHLQISELLTCMMFGIVLVNFCPIASKKIFRTLSKITAPLYIAFFVTAGAHLRVDIIPQIWFLGFVYTAGRLIGKVSGASLGARVSNAPPMVKKYIGFGLISQVGVAIGLALIVSTKFSGLGVAGKELSSIVINVLLTTTLFTEVAGPLMTKYALIKSGEAKG